MKNKSEIVIVRKSFKYRAYCNKGTRRRAIKVMRFMAQIWNTAIKERWETFKLSKTNDEVKPINSYYGQYHIIRKKDHPEYKSRNAQSMQDVLIKLDGSFKSYFKLHKKDEMAMPPGQKQIHRCLTYRNSGWKIEGNNLFISDIGRFKLRLHRPIEGKIKTVSIKLDQGKFYVSFSCILTQKTAKVDVAEAVKIEFADRLFIKDSAGSRIKQPGYYFEEIDRLRRLSRSLSRKMEGSHNRVKDRHKLRKWHRKIAEKRRHFLWSVVNYYINSYQKIIVPKMPLKEKIMHATTSRKAQKICDAAYGIFCSMLKNKAKEKGVIVEEYAL